MQFFTSILNGIRYDSGWLNPTWKAHIPASNIGLNIHLTYKYFYLIILY